MSNVEVIKLAELSGHAGPIYCIKEAHQKDMIYSASADKMLALWDINTYKPMAFSVKADASIFTFLFLPEYNYLCLGLSSGAMHVIDLTQKKEIKNLAFHKKAIFHIVYNPHKNYLYVASAEGIISVWSVPQFKLVLQLPLGNFKIRHLSLFDNYFAAACGDGSIRVFETEFFNMILNINAHYESVYALKHSARHNLLFSGGKDAHLKVWDISKNYALIKSIPAHNYAIYSIDLSPDENYLITGSRDKTIKLWDVCQLSILKRLDRKNFGAHTHSVNTVLWFKKNVFISAGDDKKIMLWQLSIN